VGERLSASTRAPRRGLGPIGRASVGAALAVARPPVGAGVVAAGAPAVWGDQLDSSRGWAGAEGRAPARSWAGSGGVSDAFAGGARADGRPREVRSFGAAAAPRGGRQQPLDRRRAGLGRLSMLGTPPE